MQSYERDRIKYVTTDIIVPSCCHAINLVLDTNASSAFPAQTLAKITDNDCGGGVTSRFLPQSRVFENGEKFFIIGGGQRKLKPCWVYVYVCKEYEQKLCVYITRLSNYCDMNFSDEEVLTLYLF